MELIELRRMIEDLTREVYSQRKEHTEARMEIPEGNRDPLDLPEGCLKEDLGKEEENPFSDPIKQLDEDSLIDWSSPPIYDIYPDEEDVFIDWTLNPIYDANHEDLKVDVNLRSSYDLKIRKGAAEVLSFDAPKDDQLVHDWSAYKLFDERSHGDQLENNGVFGRNINILATEVASAYPIGQNLSKLSSTTSDPIWDDFLAKTVDQARFEVDQAWYEETTPFQTYYSGGRSWKFVQKSELFPSKGGIFQAPLKINLKLVLRCTFFQRECNRKKGWRGLLGISIDRGKHKLNSRTSSFPTWGELMQEKISH